MYVQDRYNTYIWVGIYIYIGLDYLCRWRRCRIYIGMYVCMCVIGADTQASYGITRCVAFLQTNPYLTEATWTYLCILYPPTLGT